MVSSSISISCYTFEWIVKYKFEIENINLTFLI